MATTPNLGLPYPEGYNPDDVPKDLKALAIPIDANLQVALDRVAATEAEARRLDRKIQNVASVASSPADFLKKIIVVSDTEPANTSVDGVPVLWIDTRDKAKWVAKAPTASEATGSIIIPTDEGATYRVNGVDKPAGSYTVPVGEAWKVTAVPNAGYTLAGVTSWDMVLTGISSMGALSRLITADAPVNYLPLSSDLSDKGSAPMNLTGSYTKGGWGRKTTAQGAADEATATLTSAMGIQGQSEWTVEFVLGGVHLNDAAYQYQQIMNAGAGLTSILVDWKGVLSWQAYTASYTSSGSPVISGVHHVALIASGGTLTLYVDGKAIGSGSYTKATAATTSTFQLFGKLYGELGQVAIYRKALTPARILEHAQAVGKS